MHSRSIRCILGTALLLTLPVVASAQTARVEGMNTPGDYIKDYTAIYGWPSSINNVGNLVYGELGDVRTNSSTGNPITLDRGVGAVLNNLWDGRFGTWGVHLREQQPAMGQGDAFSQNNPGTGGGDPNTHTNESFDLMWGHKMGGTSLGLRVNRSFFKAEDEIPGITTTLEFNPAGSGIGGGADDLNLARNVMGFSAGVGFEMNPETSVELAVLWQNRSFEFTTSPTAKYEDDGGTNYSFQGRAMWKWNANTVVTPVVKWYSYDLSTKTTSGGPATTTDNSIRGWQAGIAGNWTVGSNDLFVMGVQFAQNKLEQEYDVFGIVGGILPGGPTVPDYSDSLKITETFSPNVFASLETHVNSWLTLRFGAQKGAFHAFKIEDETRGHKLTINDSPFSMNIGAGVKVGTLMLDAVLDTLFPHNPAAQFVGGDNSSFAGFVSFPKVTATYTF